MSNFWDNNKEAIYKNTSKAAKTTGKYAWAGTKTLSKAGYNAAKGNPQSISSEKADEPLDFGETRSLSSLPDVTKFPPPPLKPGQKQYTSEKLKAQIPQPAPPQSALQTGESQHQQAEGQYQQQHQRFPAQPQLTQYQQAPPQASQQILRQAPTHISDQRQQVRPVPSIPTRETIAVPPTEVTVGTTTLNIPAYNIDKQQALNISGQLVSGIFKTQQTQDGQSSGASVEVGQSLPGSAVLPQRQTPSAQPTALLQQPALDYSNPYYQGAFSAPQEPQITAPLEISPVPLQPVDGRAPPPPPTRDYLRPQAAVPQQLIARETSTPSPDLSGFAIPPRRTISTVPYSTEEAEPQQVPPIASVRPEPVSTSNSSHSVNLTAPFSRTGSVSSPSAPREEPIFSGQEEPVSKGIAGKYDYKIDVKFAPPPVRRDAAVRSPHSNTVKHSTSGIKSPSLSSVPKASSGSQRPIPAPSSRSSISAESITGSGPPPPPSRTLSANFPPPPRPTNPMTHQSNEVHHPQPPLRTHISSSSIPRTPPPSYSPTNGLEAERDILDDSVPVNHQSPPDLNISKHAHPPKPSKKPQDLDLSELEVKKSSPELVIPATKREVFVDKSDTTPKPLIPTKPAFGMNAFPPPPRAPAKSKYVENTTEELFEVIKLKNVKPKPLVPAHKPQIDIKKKIPPPVKPKPDLSMKVPPPINPKTHTVKKTPPPVKPKPQIVAEGGDDNPFSRYLKAAVPEEDDRFHRR